MQEIRTINELKNYTRAKIESIIAEELKVNINFIKKCQQCVAANGGHFQHQK